MDIQENETNENDNITTRHSLDETSFKRFQSENFLNLKSFKDPETLEKKDSLKNSYKKTVSVFKEFVKTTLYDGKGIEMHDQKYRDILLESFEEVSPLIYLTPEQKKGFLKCVKFYKFGAKTTVFSGIEEGKDPGNWAAFILLEGELHVFDNKSNFEDIIDTVQLIGYDGPIFRKRFNTVLAEKNTVLALLPEKEFKELLTPFSKFATFVSRNIIHKDKTLDSLTKFKNYILQYNGKSGIDIETLLKLYRKINSCLHPHCNSEQIDFTAWAYSLNRLPQSILETYVLILMNKPKKVLFSRDDVVKEITPKIITTARNRDVFRYMEGKNIIVVREMETDVLDILSNMCIHIIEANKLRKLISSPKTLSLIYDTRGNFDLTMDVLRKDVEIDVKEFAEHTMKKLFGDKFAEKLLNLYLHYQDYSINIKKLSNIDKDPVERWVQNLWVVGKNLLGVSTSVDEIDDLVVDIFQGSKRTLLGCISPHLYKSKDEILAWASDNNIQLKTKVFLNECDKLLAYSYYYYKAFPDKSKEKDLMDMEHGVVLIDQTFSTGVQVLLINTNKLDPKYVDPTINLKPASKNHIILHIGYTFGAQSGHIIKPLLMLFGSKARSMNIIGKAGGLAGNRTDILVANKIFYDKTHELANLNYGNLNVEDLSNTAKSSIHVGPMLTVAGTIIQNNDLLYFYKNVMGCVGIEMEGYFFVKEIENSIKHGLLKPDFVTRCFYYASDIPLDPNQNLAQEDGNVSWDEGVCSMNAIQRYILRQVLGEY